jgi:PTH2 family peptidyl-tRNA hydrolase
MCQGKVAAQVAHGALGAYRATLSKGAEGQGLLHQWEMMGEAVICLGVADEAELRAKLEEAARAGLTTHLIADAGRTEVAGGSVTVGTVGPDLVTRIDPITGRLQLL